MRPLLLNLFATVVTAVQVCLPLGPFYPVPTALSESTIFTNALRTLSTTIDQSLRPGGSNQGSLDPNATSFMIDIYSWYEEEPLFTYGFSAPDLADNEDGVSNVTENTIFRIGSMSKLLSVYNFLIHAGDASWSQPITKYIPELAKAASENAGILQHSTIENVDWNSVTIGSLASQLSGIARESPFGPVADSELLNNFPLPVVPPINATFCNPPDEVQFPCTRADFFAALLEQRPAAPSWHTPIYSNIAYQILSYALEAITGMPFEQSMQQGLIDALFLQETFLQLPPSTNNSIIPYNQSWSNYAWDLRDEAPAAGYYSSIHDLRLIGKSILRSGLLPQYLTRRWMKPMSFTGSPNISVGAPWEIVRVPTERNIWMYTKGGHVGAYTSEIILIPEYGIGASVLTAGVAVSQDVDLLSNLFATIVAPVLEDAAKEEAAAVYTGRYYSAGSNESITILADGYPGLLVSHMTYNQSDALEVIAELSGAGPEGIEVRLWPTTLVSRDDPNTNNITAVSWRMVVQKLPLVPAGPFLGNCISWFQVAQLTYGGIGMDEVVFTIDSDRKKAINIDVRFFEAVYTR